MNDLLRKAYDGGANGLRTITCVMLFGVFLGGANSHVKASDSRAVTTQQKITKNATTLSTSTQSNKAQLDVSKLVGADPRDLATLSTNEYRITPNSDNARKATFLLLNVGTEKFFNIGGAYGRHASLSNTGMYLWIWNNSKTEGTYNIRTRLNYVIGSSTVTENKDNADSYVQYIDNDSNMPGIYPDCQPTDENHNFGWKFEQAKEYSETNKVYKISTYEDKDGNRRYLTATPEDTDGNLCKAEALSNSENQVWKLVTLQEYYDLFKNSPSDPNSPIDITFLLGNPGFDYNKSNAPFWASSGKAHDFRLGVEDYYKKTTEAYYKDNVGNEISFNDNLYQNGKYFCADIKNQHKYKVSQSINVTQPGWYIIRCNGFSNTNFANLFITDVLSFYGFTTDEKYKMTVPLTQLSTNGPKDLLEAGKRFYNGEYENEVRIYISQEDIDYLEEYKLQEAIYFGIELEGDDNPNPQNEWTAFDNFRLLYAGESEGAPKLVLDEDNPDLKYLTETIEEYKNCNLHLKRSFELNKWNTLILPVDLTYGQMKEAFGNEVKLAELYKLTPNSVRFKTVECNSDNDVMLEAYTPYIIKPTKEAGQNSAYTTPRLKKAANQYWLGENESKSYTNEDVERYTGGKVSISESHYDIPNVTLDRTLLNTKLDNHWVSTTTTSTTAPDADNNNMVCKGTMAKTFYIKGSKGYFYEERDDLKGDYFMNKGIMYKVPNTKQYGLKAFRCWFELTKTTDTGTINTSPAKDVKLFINEIEDETTGIDDIITDPAFSHAAYQYDGVYNLQGQLVRQGTSLEGLPQGIYIVKGKKVKK